MTLPALQTDDLDVSLECGDLSPLWSKRYQDSALQGVVHEIKLETLQKDYAELNAAIFEAAQVHRRLCAPSLVRHGSFEIASEIFAVRHLPGDFFCVEDTRDGLLLALGDIGGKGLAAGMWVTHLI